MFKKIFLTAAIIFALAAPVFVSAQGLNDALGNLNAIAGTEKTGLSGDLPTVVATVIKAVLALVGTVFLVLTIYAGILWMTAQGEEEKVTKAKEIIKASIIGLVIIMSAYAITYFVTSRLAGATGTTGNPTGGNEANLEACLLSSETECPNVTDGSGARICDWDSAATVCKPL